jgi:hypothetical protein
MTEGTMRLLRCWRCGGMCEAIHRHEAESVLEP